ncbi:hypothetical protein FisN_UnNu094 [Fistulifera solaris]|uniref:Reverse transcriptase n=1 Tax=Fistulifera solaris TaxID=1519565 RepID=A0A1Z5KA20_FISSO|nr:hypothetical protein FisN_UnNu094 [Fistulifera solaris]|eukprot:GAX23113.1 hypothetical protein FisN_UnNu094 [Fistulifera solaris]
MSRQLSIPSIYMRNNFKNKRPVLRGVSAKFELRDEPANADSGIHKKSVTLFDGEYGGDNARFWCQWEPALREVFQRKPCTTGPARFGVTSSCLTGKALNDFQRARATVATETLASFEVVLSKVKKEYFHSDTPRKDQLDYIETLRKPGGATFSEFVSEIDQMIADLKYFPEDLGADGEPLPVDEQPTLDENSYRRLMLKAVPATWLNKLTNNGTDPNKYTPAELFQRFKRMEVQEQAQQHFSRQQGTRSKTPDTKRNKTNNRDGKWCSECNSATHNTSDCRRKANKEDDNKNPRDRERNRSTASFIHHELIPKQYWRKCRESPFETKGGDFRVKYVAAVEIILPELSTTRSVQWTFYIDPSDKPRFGLLLGSDFLEQNQINISYSRQSIEWDGAIARMQAEPSTSVANALHVIRAGDDDDPNSSPQVKATARRATKILDAKYEKANLDEVVANITTLNPQQKKALLKLLRKFEFLFDGTLGDFDCEPADVTLKPGHDQPYHARTAFSVPHIHRKTLYKEIKRLVALGVLKRNDDSPHAYPTFIIPKANGTVRFVTDFRKLNAKLQRRNFPPPTIADILHNLEGFQYATALDLNMGYYTIRLTPFAQDLCTILTPWGKYSYQRLPMGISVASDIFQLKIMSLMSGLEDFVRTYLDDLLIIGRGSFEDHLSQIEQVLQRLQAAGLKVNAPKSTFFATQIEYLGFWLTRDGITPVRKKIDAILNMDRPKSQKDVRRFIGMINFYRDMWRHRSTILAPLTELTKKSEKAKFLWEPRHEHAFKAIKDLLSRDVALAYPDFKEKFTIYTDASKTQLGAVIMQKGKPIAFYSRKLTPAQQKYTTTERELLSIVETLREYRSILLGYEIDVWTDHKNLTFETHPSSSDRIHRWLLYIEEFGPTLHYIKGEANVVADALSRLPLKPTPEVEGREGSARNINTHGASTNLIESPAVHAIQTRQHRKYTERAQHFFAKRQRQQSQNATTTDTPNLRKRKREETIQAHTSIPISYETIAQHQWNDTNLLEQLETHNDIHIEKIQNFSIMKRDGKILVPTTLRKPIIQWYHQNLCHPGLDRTELTIRRNFHWNNIRADVRKTLADCHECKMFKKKTKKYGHLPAKEAEFKPWKRLCVDIIGPYTVRDANHREHELLALTMIDPATSWFEVVQISDKSSETVALAVDRQWFCRYPRPHYITYDQGGEFTGNEFQELLTSYGVKGKPASARNPQSNSVVERVHLTLHNMLRTFNFQQQDMDPKDPWSGFLAATAYAIRSTFHTSNLATPAELIFGRDILFDRPFHPDFEKIRRHKQSIINTNNKRENAKRIKYTYHPGDRVLYKRRDTYKHAQPYDGPYEVLKVYPNGTVQIAKGDRKIKDRINIRLLHPYTPRNR